MKRNDAEGRLTKALQKLEANDQHLLENDLSERCIAARLAMYLQCEFPEHSVDVEYNRRGENVKRLHLSPECIRRRNRKGDPPATPDIVVHTRGSESPNILVLELKKTSNPVPRNCDQIRVHAFRDQLGYKFGALVECKTRPDEALGVSVEEWIGD